MPPVILPRTIAGRRTLLISCFCIVALCTSAAAAESIVREVGPPDAGGVITVTLSFPGTDIWGVAETLPEGFAYVDSSLPPSRVLVRGDLICFSVVNESTVTYRVRAADPESGEIAGAWWDFTARTNGTVQPSAIAAGGVETTTPSASGPGACLSVLGLLAVSALLRWRR
ncbi:MAG: hypothetical protein PWP08_316 [Methanofollis sp.]|nr:hypothetical protein [Methanofollis sp.]